jgi:hypothetical protein
MTGVFIALGVVAWLFFLLLGLGLARTAARGDAVMRRAVAKQLRCKQQTRQAA